MRRPAARNARRALITTAAWLVRSASARSRSWAKRSGGSLNEAVRALRPGGLLGRPPAISPSIVRLYHRFEFRYCLFSACGLR